MKVTTGSKHFEQDLDFLLRVDFQRPEQYWLVKEAVSEVRGAGLSQNGGESLRKYFGMLIYYV